MHNGKLDIALLELHVQMLTGGRRLISTRPLRRCRPRKRLDLCGALRSGEEDEREALDGGKDDPVGGRAPEIVRPTLDQIARVDYQRVRRTGDGYPRAIRELYLEPWCIGS